MTHYFSSVLYTKGDLIYTAKGKIHICVRS